jgi:hypothetical protein
LANIKPSSSGHGTKNTEVSIIRSSAAEYLTYVAVGGESDSSVEMRYEDENVWLTQKMMAALYVVSVPAINQHLKHIFSDNELVERSVVKRYLITVADGKKYKTKHYSLQAIIAIGFIIENERAVQFRKWANQIVKDYTIQGWTRRLPMKTIPSCIFIDPNTHTPRMTDTVKDYEQYPVIGRNPPKVTV